MPLVILVLFVLSVLSTLGGFGGLNGELGTASQFLAGLFIVLFIGSIIYRMITEDREHNKTAF